MIILIITTFKLQTSRTETVSLLQELFVVNKSDFLEGCEMSWRGQNNELCPLRPLGRMGTTFLIRLWGNDMLICKLFLNDSCIWSEIKYIIHVKDLLVNHSSILVNS